MSKTNETKKRRLTPIFVKGPAEIGASGQEWMTDEFPTRKSIPEVARRDLLKMMGGALALAGLNATGCRYAPQRKIVPFVDQNQGDDAGKRRKFASAAVWSGYAVGVLVDQIDGRPIRIDGNPNHPASLGSLNSPVMAEMLNFYDPDRMTIASYQGDPGSWNDAVARINEQLAKSKDGTGVRILSEAVCSPTLAAVADRFKRMYPQAKWHQYEAVNEDNAREGAVFAFGQPVDTIYHFDKADVVVSLDGDFQHQGPASVRYSRDIASRRDPDQKMSRIYALEAQPTTVGMVSDHRVRVKTSEALPIALALAQRLGVPVATGASLPQSVDAKLFEAMAKDLEAARGASVVVPGRHLPREVHAVCQAINEHLGNFGTTVSHTNPVRPMPVNFEADFQDLVTELKGNAVQTLIILGGNPVYTAPGDANFGQLVEQVPYSVYLGTHMDETAAKTKWQLPVSHFLEAWGDGVAFDGTYSIVQPLIEPIYDTRSAVEFLDMLTGGAGQGEEVTKKVFSAKFGSAESTWTDALATGVVPNTAAAEVQMRTQPGVLGTIAPKPANGMELVILPDPSVYDGRYANNNWLQELPNPITNLTWDNALLVSHATAEKLGVKAPFDKHVAAGILPFYGDADVVTVTVGANSIDVPVWVNYGQADDVLILNMGYGRTEGGQFAKVRTIGPLMGTMPVGGVDANQLRTMANPIWVDNVQVTKTNKQYPLANTQHHNTIDVTEADKDRDLIHIVTAAELASGETDEAHEPHEKLAGPPAAHERNYDEHGEGEDYSFYSGSDFAEKEKLNYQWAMTIDLAKCTGCNACVLACQAENNIPTVEKDQVMRGRELHWMRIDRYYKGTGDSIDKDNPPIYVQPVTCMQCEQAPCEPVCPVAATVHSSEGINQMVYNRCVGTRYCSNNCPYKVRRFNFFHYSQRADQIPVLKMLQNPDVTVRFRGVMEKCTYCVQRINHARIEAKKEHRKLEDGEVMTACQVACPSRVIIFGDKSNPETLVSKSREHKRNYMMLEELNTRPRTTYLSKVTNPNPEVQA